jgi:hypothetical protein
MLDWGRIRHRIFRSMEYSMYQNFTDLLSWYHWHRWPQKIDFIVEYFREYEAICKKALTRGSRAQMELFDEKNMRKNMRKTSFRLGQNYCEALMKAKLPQYHLAPLSFA